MKVALPSFCAGNGALRLGSCQLWKEEVWDGTYFVLVETKFPSYLI